MHARKRNSRTPKCVGHRVGLVLVIVWFAIVLNHVTAEALPDLTSPSGGVSLPGAELFQPGRVHRIQIQITSQDLVSLQKEAREFVRASISEEGNRYTNVAVHLKGSVGSFRPIDEKPSWTLDFERFSPGQKFHGLRRIHLNNSVEDPSYCNEWLGSELFRKAGVPAPRVSHAVVTFNGRALGLFVLKEGFTEDFLSCHFKNIGGNLYEPDEGHDVNQRLKRISVQAPRTDRMVLDHLAEAALDPDVAHRWSRLENALDTKQFITFAALEVLLCHRDGYCLARNNFRVYQDVDSGKVMFFPHGMDQLLGSPELPWRPQMAGLVARALIETPEGKKQYRERFSLLFTNLFRADWLSAKVDEVTANLRPVLTDAEFASVSGAAAIVKTRIVARKRSLAEQLAEPETKLLEFKDGVAHLQGWVAAGRPANGKMDESKSSEGVTCLRIVTFSETFASWKAKALLDPGHYRFEGRASASGIKPLPTGVHQGAGLRIAGQLRQSPDVVGDSPWRLVSAEFDVEREATELEFVCELRAESGEVRFALDSLKVIRLP